MGRISVETKRKAMAYFQQKVYIVVIFLYFRKLNTIDPTQKFQLTLASVENRAEQQTICFKYFCIKWLTDSLIKQKIRGISLVIY